MNYCVRSMRIDVVLLAVAMAVSTVAYGGVLGRTCPRQGGDFVLESGTRNLDRLDSAWRAQGCDTIKCPGPGWFAAAYSEKANARGMSCGASTRQKAESLALDACRSRSSAGDCEVRSSAYDDDTVSFVREYSQDSFGNWVTSGGALYLSGHGYTHGYTHGKDVR